MNDRVYSTREQRVGPLASTGSSAQLQSHDSSNSITSNIPSSSSSSSSSSNLSNLSLSDIEEADQLPVTASTVRAANVSEDATGNRASSRPPARTAYSGLSTVGIGFRGFQNTILSPAQRIAKDSLPSPPATNREGESERGSIDSARRQTGTRHHDSSNTRESSTTQGHMQSSRNSDDPYATIRRSPVNSSLANQQASPDLVIVEHGTHHARKTQHSDTISPNARSSRTHSQSSSSSGSLRSRSVSPLATIGTQTSAFHMDQSPQVRGVAGSVQPKGTIMSHRPESASSANGKQLSRTASTTSNASRQTSDMNVSKGKGRELTSLGVERKPSITASKIREASQASRARVSRAGLRF